MVSAVCVLQVIALFCSTAFAQSPIPQNWSDLTPLEQRDELRDWKHRAPQLSVAERNAVLRALGELYQERSDLRPATQQFLEQWATQEAHDPEHTTEDPRLAYLNLLQGPLTAWSAGYAIGLVQSTRLLMRRKPKCLSPHCGKLLMRMTSRAGPARWSRRNQVKLTLIGLSAGALALLEDKLSGKPASPGDTLSAAEEQTLDHFEENARRSHSTLEEVTTLSKTIRQWKDLVLERRPEFAPRIQAIEDQLMAGLIRLRTEQIERVKSGKNSQDPK